MSGPSAAGSQAPAVTASWTGRRGAVTQVPTQHAVLADWIDHVVELSRTATGTFPRAVVADHLAETFGCHVSWNWAEPDGRFGFELQRAIPGWTDDADFGAWLVEGLRTHPLLVWFSRTQDPSAMTVGRVPDELAPPRDRNYLEDLLAPHGHEQQLSIPSHLGPRSYRAFVLAQGREDFSDAQLDLARRLQPLLAMLDRQAEVTARVRSARCSPPADLTSREVAVLGLLAEGLTAAAIGHRLLVSPRTVHCHLSHAYRKLGVADRMMAVTVARELGLVPAAAADRRAADPGLSGPSFEWPGPPVYGPEEDPADRPEP